MPSKKKDKSTGPIKEADLPPRTAARIREYYRLYYLYKMVLSKLRTNEEGSAEHAHMHVVKDMLLTKEEEQLIKRLDPASSIRKEPVLKISRKKFWRRPGQNRAVVALGSLLKQIWN